VTSARPDAPALPFALPLIGGAFDDPMCFAVGALVERVAGVAGRPSLRADFDVAIASLWPCRIHLDTISVMRSVVFLGDSRKRLREFPLEARARIGAELMAVQIGSEPTDWKPMPTIGSGVREIRVRTGTAAFRVIYLLVIGDQVLVLHAFQKKSQKTPAQDIALAARRLAQWKEARR
jgi:phage-related protein